MKIGASILSLPRHRELEDDTVLDFVDITRLKLLSEKSFNPRLNSSMMSVIDTALTKGLTFKSSESDRQSIINSIAESMVLAESRGLRSISFGSPGLRQVEMSTSELQSLFIEIVQLADQYMTSPMTLYVEPLPNEFGTLDSYLNIVTLSNFVNAHSQSKYVVLKPLFDTGWYMTVRHDKEETQHESFQRIVSRTTDRIHFSHSDTKTKFDENTFESNYMLMYLDLIVMENPDITIVYEHLNFDNNDSAIKFAKAVRRRYRLQVED